jgi:hypothetical protein
MNTWRAAWEKASLLAMLPVGLMASGCTERQLSGQSSAYAIVDEITAASGADPEHFAGTLESDVVTYRKRTLEGKVVFVPAIFEDFVRVTMRLALKDPGTPDAKTSPSDVNAITFTRYHVTYLRADGRNVPGQDVPYGFDGGMTLTVGGPTASTTDLVLVRAQAKDESPLRAMAAVRDDSGQIVRSPGGAIAISTIAELSFYGTDQAGRSVTATASISVNFADWADPDANF